MTWQLSLDSFWNSIFYMTVTIFVSECRYLSKLFKTFGPIHFHIQSESNMKTGPWIQHPVQMSLFNENHSPSVQEAWTWNLKAWTRVWRTIWRQNFCRIDFLQFHWLYKSCLFFGLSFQLSNLDQLRQAKTTNSEWNCSNVLIECRNNGLSEYIW